MTISIGEAARRAGCTPATIRYYESIGLLKPGPRTAKGRRVFGRPDVHRLVFIRRARGFGLSIDDVRALLFAPGRSSPEVCTAAAAVVERHLADIRCKQAELERLEASLAAILDSCRQGCGDAQCSIFDDISGKRADQTL